MFEINYGLDAKNSRELFQEESLLNAMNLFAEESPSITKYYNSKLFEHWTQVSNESEKNRIISYVDRFTSLLPGNALSGIQLNIRYPFF